MASSSTSTEEKKDEMCLADVNSLILFIRAFRSGL